MPTQDFRTRLAGRTRDAHARVEREAALDGAMPVARYHAYLRGMHAVLRSVEPLLERDPALAALGLDMPARRKLAWLERDLEHFGLEHAAASSTAMGSAIECRLGWAYVLEGSTLGGRVLHRRLAARWPLTSEHGGAFLWGYGERTGEMWRRFVDALNAAPFDSAQRDTCVAAANAAFEAIGAALRDSIAGAGLRLGGERDLAA